MSQPNLRLGGLDNTTVEVRDEPVPTTADLRSLFLLAGLDDSLIDDDQVAILHDRRDAVLAEITKGPAFAGDLLLNAAVVHRRLGISRIPVPSTQAGVLTTVDIDIRSAPAEGQIDAFIDGLLGRAAAETAFADAWRTDWLTALLTQSHDLPESVVAGAIRRMFASPRQGDDAS
jgi:hypothetical protein